jgi:endoglucanase
MRLALCVTLFALLSSEASAQPPSTEWFVDEQSPANQALARGVPVGPIARQPRFGWFGPFAGPPRIRDYVGRASAAGKVALIALFNVEARECKDLGTARRFYAEAARAIGDARAVVAFEPDSLGTMTSAEAACFRTIAYGIRLFARLPQTDVYVDAGASDWEGAPRMAKKLRRVDVCRAGGVLLNATHADWTLANIRFGRALGRRIRGCRLKLLVNTAENGQGPTPRTVPRHWCDKGQRYGLGPVPESPTRHPGVIYGWVNRPGYTQKCYDPPVRWADYRALNLIRNASGREG